MLQTIAQKDSYSTWWPNTWLRIDAGVYKHLEPSQTIIINFGAEAGGCSEFLPCLLIKQHRSLIVMCMN